MTIVQHAIIAGIWAAWLITWLVSAADTKPTVYHEGIASRASHHLPVIVGGLMLAIPHLLGATLAQPFHVRTPEWFWTSVALLVGGLGFAILARVYLGRNWSGFVTVKRDHELIRSGPYAVVRHPIYSGLILALLGTVLAIDRWSALLGLALMIAGLIRKMTIEEQIMIKQFGGAYVQYRNRVSSLMPFIF